MRRRLASRDWDRVLVVCGTFDNASWTRCDVVVKEVVLDGCESDATRSIRNLEVCNDQDVGAWWCR